MRTQAKHAATWLADTLSLVAGDIVLDIYTSGRHICSLQSTTGSGGYGGRSHTLFDFDKPRELLELPVQHLLDASSCMR